MRCWLCPPRPNRCDRTHRENAMRIGISCYPTHGGSGVVATELGLRLAERGHSVAFVSYSAPLRLSVLPPRVCFHEVAIEEYPLLKQFPYTLALASKLAEVARSHRLRILHVHYAIPFAAAAILAKQIAPELDLKVVTTLHGTDITLVGSNDSFRPVTAFCIERSDAVTAVSHALRAETGRVFGITRPIEVIPNFVDPDHYRSARPAAWPGDRSAAGAERVPTIVHISNFRPVKRAADVVRVFARVAGEVPARLVLVGDGPDLGPATDLARELGVLDRIRLIGVVDDVAPYLRAADLLLLPSQTEAFGLVALEALAAGVPVIASRVGGLPEVVEHGVSGYLLPVGDVEGMARQAVTLLRERPLAERLGRAGAGRVAEQFPPDRIVPRFEELYHRVLGLPAGTEPEIDDGDAHAESFGRSHRDPPHRERA